MVNVIAGGGNTWFQILSNVVNSMARCITVMILRHFYFIFFRE